MLIKKMINISSDHIKIYFSISFFVFCKSKIGGHRGGVNAPIYNKL